LSFGQNLSTFVLAKLTNCIIALDQPVFMTDTKPRVLFVDDEENIRIMLGMVLERNGFHVTSVGTVPEALKLIAQQEFDVLIADLNVGFPGDGFTVVSAMRRTRPGTVTFILTGYPAFDTALEAIRLQVDDYVTKPTDIEALIDKIRSKLSGQSEEHRIRPRRLTEIIAEHLQSITDEWLQLCRADPELGAIRISDAERSDHVPRVIQQALGIALGDSLSDQTATAAHDHGIVRKKQGFTVPLLIRETRLLQGIISHCVQVNLLAIEISHLLTDMISVNQTIQVLLEQSVVTFLEESKKEAA
jgi:DNA-binding response OmpR family regulator